MAIKINSIDVKQLAGLVKVEATTDVVGYLDVQIYNSAGNLVEKIQSFYPNRSHVFSFWLPNDSYSFDFLAYEVPRNKDMVFCAWGQTNVPFDYFDVTPFSQLT